MWVLKLGITFQSEGLLIDVSEVTTWQYTRHKSTLSKYMTIFCLQIFFDLVRQINKTAPTKKPKISKRSRCICDILWKQWKHTFAFRMNNSTFNRIYNKWYDMNITKQSSSVNWQKVIRTKNIIYFCYMWLFDTHFTLEAFYTQTRAFTINA